MYKFSKKSLEKINHPKFSPVLKELLERAIETSPIDFTVIETVRTIEKQREYVKRGTSKTMKSRHIAENNKSGLCEAVDIAPYPIEWGNVERFKELAEHINKTAQKLRVVLRWGGDWKTFKDYPHWEIKNR